MQKATSKKSIYRISFLTQNTVYEIYAKNVDQSDIFGFIEIEDVLFGETSSLVVDPSEERLKSEFNGVKRSYIPLHAILRIDLVEKEGAAKITSLPHESGNVTQFPGSIYSPRKKTD